MEPTPLSDEQMSEIRLLQRQLRTLRSDLGFCRDHREAATLRSSIGGKQARLDSLFPARITPIAE